MRKTIVNTVLIISYAILTLYAAALIQEYYLVLNDQIGVNDYSMLKGVWSGKVDYLGKLIFPAVYFSALTIISWITYFTRRERGNLKYFYIVLVLVILYFFMF